MFIFYNFLNFSYWTTSLLANLIMIVLSYHLYKKFTFQNKNTDIRIFVFFCIHILVCYLIAYKIARSMIFFLSIKILRTDNLSAIDNTAMFLGMLIFTFLNFIGQKHWVFKKKG